MNKKGFSLFELLLVVILIGLVYSIVLKKVDKKKTVKINTLENIKSTLNSPTNDKVEFVVYDSCKKIQLKGLNKEVDIDIKLFKDISVYKVNESQSLEKVEFSPIFLNNKVYDVCFRFTIYPNKSSSSYIVKQKDRYIVFYPYFEDSFIAMSEQEAIDKLINKEAMESFKDELY